GNRHRRVGAAGGPDVWAESAEHARTNPLRPGRATVDRVAARSVRAATSVCATLLFLPVTIAAQAPDTDRPRATTSEAPATWQYGAFVDVAYLRDFNHPQNRTFRGRGTTWRVEEWDLNMAGAFLKMKADAETRWGAELLVQEGKD